MFDTYKLNDNGLREMRVFKSAMANAAKTVLEMMEGGREKALFTTKLEEAVFFGAKAIAQKPGNSESKETY